MKVTALIPSALVAILLVACGASAQTGSLTTNRSPATVAPSVSDSGEALQKDLVAVVQRVSPSVVQIQDSQGLGSGIVFDNKGDIVTNAHVVDGATSFQVTFADGKSEPATLVASYPPEDVAVIRVQGSEALQPATFANSSKIQVGDIVLAIGSPLGLSSSVTEGIVSALRTGIPEGNGVTLPSAIQTSAAINPGNSGGALVDLNGDVVGIPTLAAIDPELGGSAPGIGFAIPSNTVTDLATQMVDYGHVVNSHLAYLGVTVADSDVAQGAVIEAVAAGSPAAAAGLTVGEVIVSIDGRPVQTAQNVSSIVAGLQPGQTVSVGITNQDGFTSTVKVTLGTYPGD